MIYNQLTIKERRIPYMLDLETCSMQGLLMNNGGCLYRAQVSNRFK